MPAPELLSRDPLSPLQEGMLFQALLAPGAGVNVEQVVCRLDEAVEPERLRRAWCRVSARHDVLRTRFPWAGGAERVQEVLAGVAVEMAWHDWAALPPAERAERLERHLRDDRAREFDLAQAPPTRLALFRMGADEHVLLWTFHHALLDGRSVGHVLQEVFALYDAAEEGPDAALPERRPFREHVAWLRGRDPAADEAYWTARLRGMDAPERVPAIRRAPRDPAAEPLAGDREVLLSAAETRALRDFEAARGVWLSTLVQGAWALLLGRYTASGEAVFGVVRGGRGPEVEGAEGMVGLLINTVPVRVPLPAGARVIDWLDDIGDAGAALLPHEHAAPADIRRWSGLPPDAELFDTLVNFQPRPFDAALRALGGPWARRSVRVLRHPGLPLTLEVAAGERLRARLHYDADLFDAEAAEGILGRFAGLLRAIVANPDAPLSRLPLVAPDEREALVAAGRATRAFAVAERIEGRFARRAAERPDAPALTVAGSTLTYGELDARAEALARRLRARGVGPETRVGIALERSAELVVALLATLKAGGAYVPLDPAYPADRIAWVLEDSGAPVLVTHSDLLDRLPAFDGTVLCVDADDAATQGAAVPAIGTGPGALAYVIYTSGSTGRPKGVQVTHAGVLRLLDATDDWFGFGARDVWTLFHSAAFDFSVWETWGALLYGGRLVVVPYEVTRSPEDFHRLLVDEGVTVLNQTPSAFRQLMEADLASGLPADALRLRHVVFGGEALDPRALRPWVQRHGDERPRLVNMYGITETTVHVTWRPLTREDVERGGSPIGVPIPDLSLHLLDGGLEPVPAGVPGELMVGGAGVARGYLGRPALTAERFVPDPYAGEPGARLYRSGDLARRRGDGELEYLGRADQQVKVRGFRIETGEIEAALATHPAVAGAAVVAREDGAGERRLVAYVVPRAGAPAPAPAELRGHLAASLPDYMLPAAFVALDALPLTENGKLDRRALPAPEDAGAAVAAAPYAPPRTPVEAALAEAWSEVLGVERVGIDDNYFALGGDSIRSVRLVAAVRRRGLSIGIPHLYRCKTVRELAAARVADGVADGVERVGQPAAPPFALLDPEARDGLPPDVEDAYPASRVQLAMLYHTQRDPASLVYQNLNAYRVHTRWDEAALRRALRRVAARHPALRTSFDLAARPEPIQRVHREVEVPLEVLDLRRLEPAEQDARVEGEKGRGFDWTTPPLLRVHVHLLSDDVFRLMLAEHHAILDGWSVASLMTELLRSFVAIRDGTDYLAGAPPVARFRDFVALERQAVASPDARAFWRGVVEGAPFTALPPRAGGAAPRVDEARCAWVELPQATGDGVRATAARAGVPLKTVLLAAHLRVLALAGGTDEVVTGYVTNGRPEAEGGDRVLGVFLNTVPLRVRMEGGSWMDLVRRTWAAEQAIVPHRRFPLAEIVREAGGRPLFEAAFNFNHFHVYDALAGSGTRMEPDRFFQRTEIPLIAATALDPATGALRLRLEYDPARLDDAQVQAMGGWYARALAALAAAPETRWDADGVLDAAERDALLRLGAGAEPELPVDRCIHHLFQAQAARAPDAVALVWDDGALTYGELNERANRVAHHLAALGVGPEARVGVCLEREPALVAALLGVLKAGGAYVPLDPGYPARRLAWMLDDAGVSVLVTDARLRGSLSAPDGVRVVCLDGEGAQIAARPPHDPATATGGRSLAYVIYTSGSTGTPKGVGVEHRSVIRLVRGADYVALGPDEVVLQAAPVSFDASTLELWGPLLNGGRLALVPAGTPSVDEIGRTIQRHGVTTLWLTAGLFQVMVDERPEELGGVSQLLTGGDVVPVEQAMKLRRRFPGLRLINGYGPTENTTFTCCHTVEDGWDGSPLPIGRPIAGTHIYVLDPTLRPVPAGVAGELYAGGAGVARGYLGWPAPTAERFLPDPFAAEPGARMYRTGDRVRWRADGALEFLGRLDGQVKVRGFRVEPGEIEYALLRHPAVERAVVAPRPGGAAGTRLVAYVVGRGGAALTAAELRGHLRERLPEHLVPAAFVAVDAIPLTPNGKVDRGALPDPVRDEPAAGAAPGTEMERRVAELWAEVLGVQGVGVDENFFDAGGDSLRLFRLDALLRRRIGGAMEMVDLFRLPTVREMAARLGEAAGEKEAAIPSRPRPWRTPSDRTPPAPEPSPDPSPVLSDVLSPVLSPAPSPGALEPMVADPGAQLRDLLS